MRRRGSREGHDTTHNKRQTAKIEESLFKLTIHVFLIRGSGDENKRNSEMRWKECVECGGKAIDEK